jgi:TolB-like protein/DNA-binding winged helix-turn-helix (wHTH) protein/Flp pilus assembly protein TadD
MSGNNAAGKHYIYSFGGFTVDAEQKVLLRDGVPVPLTPKVFETLLFLVENGGRIVKKEDAMNRLWPDSFVEDANLVFNIQQLRKLLGDNARAPVYIETVSRRGYRFIAPVVADTRSNGAIENGNLARIADLAPAAETKTHVIGALKYRRSAFFVTVAAVLAAGLGGWLFLSRSKVPAQPVNEKVMLAVLPFQNLTGEADQDYFSDGLTEEIIAHLGNLSPNSLGVIGRTSVMHFKNSPATVEQIGRELQVQYVLEGSVRRDPDRVRVTVQLIQTKDQTHVWAREYDRELTNSLFLQGEIAGEVADQIQSTLGRVKISDQTLASTTKNYEAYELYLKGQYSFNKRGAENLQEAIAYFQQAADKDPGYARAYAGLANSYALMSGYSVGLQNEFMPKARAAVERALEIDPNLAEAHTGLALIVQLNDWDWQTSEKEFQRAIELNPNYATAHHWYAEHLSLLGRFDEALQESETARTLDPLSPIIAVDNGDILYLSRQYERAIQKLRSVEKMEPSLMRAHIVIHSYVEKGMFNEAQADMENWRKAEPGPWIWAELAYIYGRSGRKDDARRALEKLLALNRSQPIDAAPLVWAYAGMGNADQAFAWLEKAYQQHSNTLTRLKADPAFDALRSDPRLQDLLLRVGLAQ